MAERKVDINEMLEIATSPAAYDANYGCDGGGFASAPT